LCATESAETTRARTGTAEATERSTGSAERTTSARSEACAGMTELIVHLALLWFRERLVRFVYFFEFFFGFFIARVFVGVILHRKFAKSFF
jgi:hypothetical protein